jgi:crotonobetainyl-CoA:carnitine CoA-transferase CaiB-like acyl-CoA transferase
MAAEHASTTATEQMGALRASRVIDFGHSIAAPLAGMLLADQGATVIKVERPQGDPAHVHPAFATKPRSLTRTCMV